MIRKTTNRPTTNKQAPAGVPQAPQCKLSPADAMAGFVSFGQQASTAALMLVASGVVYMFTVNHFRTAGTDGYLSVADAQKAMRDTLEKGTGLKAAMLSRYAQLSAKAYDKAKAAKASKLIETLANAGNPEDAARAVHSWMSGDWGVTTLNDLARKTGVKKPAPDKRPDSIKVPERITNTVANIEKNMVAKGKVNEGKVAKAIAVAVSDPIRLAQEAINRIADPDALQALVKFITGHIDAVVARNKELSARAKANVGPKGKERGKPAPAKAKARSKAHANA